MARLSIVIPVLGNLQRLEDTLVSVLENRPENCEILVVLNQPYDDPYKLQGEVTFVRVASGAGLVESVNEGLLAASGSIVHLLGCGAEVSPGWTDWALGHFDDPQVAAVAAVVADRSDPQRAVSAGLACSPGGRVRRVGAGKPIELITVPNKVVYGADTLAAFFRKSSLENIGWLTPSVGDSMAGADLALALHYAGWRCVFEPLCRTSSHRLPPYESMLREGMEAERLYWRWAPAAGWFRSLVGHLGLLLLESALCLVGPAMVCRLAGRLKGCRGFAMHRHHWQSLRQPKPPPPVPAVNPPHFVPADCRKSVGTRAAG